MINFRIKKLKSSKSAEFPLQSDHKGMEMTLDANQAYETVNVRYEAGRLGQNDDPIYEQPAI